MVERYFCMKTVFTIWLHTAHLNQILLNNMEVQFIYLKIPTTKTHKIVIFI
jgi:hypothetical protein